MVCQQNADIADILQLRDVAMGNIFFAFYTCGAHWHHPANMTELFVCGLTSNYFDHLFYSLYPLVCSWHYSLPRLADIRNSKFLTNHLSSVMTHL